jgi:hypothetical protein
MVANVTATKKKAPAKRPAARTAPALPAPAPADDVIRLTSDPERVEERVALFYIDDVEYTVAKRPGVNVGLEYLHLSRTQGQEIAVDYLLGKLLGEAGYTALREYDQLTSEQFQQICEVAARLTLGAMELPKA